MIRLLVADDQLAVRMALRMRLSLEPDITIVGEADTGDEAVTLVRKLRPDVVLMDVTMPHMDGIAATKTLTETLTETSRDAEPKTAVLVLSIHDDPSTRRRALAAGATDFVVKWGGVDVLLKAIRAAAPHRRPHKSA